MARGSAVLRVDIIGDARSAQKALESTGDRVQRFGKVAAAAAAAAAVAALGVAASTVQAASHLEQSIGGTAAVFGRHAAQVEAAAKRAARTVGLSQAAYGDLANVLGAQLAGMGTAADQLAPSTDRLITLGADLAATFGGTTADAVAAVSSLLKGERDPIERYGVSLKAADVEARLAAQGLDGLTGAARTQAEAQATLQLLTERTAAAQGGAARESETFAARQAQLAAVTENLKARMGAELLPALTAVGGWLLDRGLPAAERFGAQLSTNLGPAVAAVAGFVTGRLVPAARDLHAWFTTRIAPGLRTSLLPVLAGARSAFASVSAAVERNGPALRELGNAARVVVEFLARHVAPVIGRELGDSFRRLGSTITFVLDVFGALDRAGDRVAAMVGRVRRALAGIEAPAGLRALGSLFTGAGTLDVAAAVSAARAPGALLTAAGGYSPAAGGVPHVTVTAGDVRVFLDGGELRAVVERVVDAHGRAVARRVAAGVTG